MLEISHNAQEVLNRLEEEEKTLAAQGARTNWILDRAGAQWLVQYILEHKPEVIVECGTSVGYSTIWIAESAASYGGQVYSIEKDPEKIIVARKNLQDAGHGEVIVFEGDAELQLAAWPGKQINLLFLDANKKGYLPQLTASEPYLAQNAVIIADNVLDMADRLEGFVETMKADSRYDVRIEEVGDGLLVAKKKH